MKWLRINTSYISVTEDRAISGLEFRITCIWVMTVRNSSLLNLKFPIILLKWHLNTLTPLSQKLSKIGCSQWKVFQSIPSVDIYLARLTSGFTAKFCNLESSLFALTKFVALSENNFEHKLLWASNLFKHAMKASDLISDNFEVHSLCD